MEESREQVETRPITVYEIMCDPAFAAGQRCTERPPVQLRLLIGGPLGLRARTPMGLSRANAHAPQDPRQAKPQGAYALLSRVRQKVHHMSKKQKNSSRSLRPLSEKYAEPSATISRTSSGAAIFCRKPRISSPMANGCRGSKIISRWTSGRLSALWLPLSLPPPNPPTCRI